MFGTILDRMAARKEERRALEARATHITYCRQCQLAQAPVGSYHEAPLLEGACEAGKLLEGDVAVARACLALLAGKLG